MLGLLGDFETTKGFFIPRDLHITFLVSLVAVAVKVIVFTLGSMLETSPRLENSVRNESPLYIPYCYYYKRVLILANIGDLVITAKFCARY